MCFMYKVSVIITTYGMPLLLEKAILSVLNQSFTDIELIVVDDNNPDSDSRLKTEILVTPFLSKSHHIRYVKHDHNKNGAAARNTGIAMATGKYIALLDNDDEYIIDRIEKCFNAMEDSPYEIGGVYSGCEFRKAGKAYKVIKNVKPGNFILETLASSFMFCTGSNFFIRKSIADELNGFDESFHRHQDYEFLVRFFEKYSLASINEVLLIKNNENQNLPDVEKLIKIKEQYLNKYNYLIRNLPQKEQNFIYYKHYVSVAETAIRNKKRNISKIYYDKSQQYRSLNFKDSIRKLVFYLISFGKWN